MRILKISFQIMTATLFMTLFASAPAHSGGKATILSINDVYRIEGIDGGRDGGMPRVRALRAELERAAPDLLFLHAGDFLSPSFLGRTYAGEQMIDLMNVMDGNPSIGTHDSRLFVTFGNHEFDDSHCTKKGPLSGLVDSSEFTWLASNLDFSKCQPLGELAGHRKIVPSRIVESGGLRIGLYSLTLGRGKYAPIVTDPMEVSCEQVKALRAQGADAVVALTHLSWRSDLKLLGYGADFKPLAADARQCDDGPDVVIGGHDHNSMALPSNAPRLFKADADATSAWVIEIEKGENGPINVKGRLVHLDENHPQDAMTQRLAQMWIERHDERFCVEDCLKGPKQARKQCLRTQVQHGKCLKVELARTASEIETEEIANRSFETGFGNWVADEVRKAGNADIALLNAGGIRLNYNLKAGTRITRRHLEQMFPFRNKLVVRDVPGRSVWKAVQRAVKKRGEGGWMHFSGLAVRLGAKGTVEELLVRKADGKTIALSPKSSEMIKVASISFVLANGDRHGFGLCPGIKDIWACKDALERSTNWPLSGDNVDLTGFLREQLLKLKGDLQLAKDGRLCDRGQKNCLIDRWNR